jgi:UDP-N-acetylmuramoyl-tripeptide--D-alanyl-D-alanine ligase
MVEHNSTELEAVSSETVISSLKVLGQILGITLDFSANPAISAVKVDSRLIQPGDLFVALPSDTNGRFNATAKGSSDGHDFVSSAIEQGACAAVVRHDYSGTVNVPLIRVTDTYDALWSMGRAAAQRFGGEKIAITGSSGKTTAKNFLQAATGGYAAPGSYNNHIGVPLSLAMIPSRASMAILEIGTNHPGEIGPLADMVAPSAAILLNVGTAHIENFSSKEELIVEKTSIFNNLQDKSNSISAFDLMLNYGVNFGLDRAADVNVLALKNDSAQLSVFGQQKIARVPGGGIHRAETLCAVIACLHVLGKDIEGALNLSESAIPKGRGNLRTIGSSHIVDDSYNANPDSMAKTITTFLTRSEPRKLLVIGEMLELGTVSQKAHEAVGALLGGQDAICVGDALQETAHRYKLPWFAEADDRLLDAVSARITADCAVLVKGSNRVFWQNNFVDRLAAKLNTS